MRRRLAAAAVLAGALGGAPAAAADTPVVSATVFTGAAGTAGAHVVPLSTLDACPPYTGPGALTLYPGGSTDTLPSGSTWTLAEILQCGLGIPSTDVNAVEVLRPDGAAQAPLTPTALTDASSYTDPAAPGALPVISNDGGQAQNTYTRPWRGGRDENGRDQVTDPGPVQLIVYQNAAPLAVQITARTIRRGTRRERVALSATVQTSAGTTVPASALGWRWTASTGAGSTAPAPTVTVPRGTATVTVLVSDASSGSGGTASVALSYKPVRSPGSHGGGGGHATVHSATGLGSGHPHRHPATSSGHPHRHGTTTPHTTATTSTTSTRPATQTTTPTPAAATTTTTTSTHTPAVNTTTHTAPSATAPAPSTTRTTTPAPRPRRRAAHHHPAPAPGPSRPLVRGRLLADVVPLSAARSPLTRPLPAPRSAAIASPAAQARLTVPGAFAGGAAALGLLILGAAREHRRRSPRLHR